MIGSPGEAGVGQVVAKTQTAILERLCEVFRSMPMIEMLGHARTARLMEAVETPLAGFAREFLELQQVVKDQAEHGATSAAAVAVMHAMWHLATAQAKRHGGASEGRQMASLVRAANAVSTAEAEVIAAIRARRHSEYQTKRESRVAL